MNVLLVSSKPSANGGIANWVRMVLGYVNDDESGFILHHIAYGTYKTLKHTFWERFVKQGLDIFRIQHEVRKTCKTENIDVIHITATGDWSVIRDIILLKYALWHKIPTVYHLHFGRVPDMKEKNGGKWKLLSKAISSATSIWTIDSKTYNTVQNTFINKDVRIVPNPVDFSEINQVLAHNNACENTVSFVGWIVKTKGVEELLDAWQKIHEKYQYLVLKLIGPYEPKYAEELKAKYNVDGVEFTGKMEHVATLDEIARSKIVILPSYTEGFPNVVAEAMALGKPIIATDVGAIPDMLSNDCGVLIHKKSSEQIYSALQYLVLDPSKRDCIGQNAFKKAINDYCLPNVFNSYKNLWTEIGELQKE